MVTRSDGAVQTPSVDVAAYFRDPDGDALAYSAAAPSAAAARVSVSGSTMTTVGVAGSIPDEMVPAGDAPGAGSPA
ncbi:hypothetical protein [Candidatus Palauibacter sp.]|uniref:hypothetical protein n=1 Tax=Candidatus Palauibacter sp. TaxID=3101350 RepID=UPI003CC5FF34